MVFRDLVAKEFVKVPRASAFAVVMSMRPPWRVCASSRARAHDTNRHRGTEDASFELPLSPTLFTAVTT
jgi:hypothetical protein